VICVSGAVEKQLRHALGVNSKFPAVTVFEPQEPVYVTNEEVQARRSSLGLDASALVVGEFARIHPIKGIDILIKAAPIVLEKLPNVQFLIVGDTDGSDSSTRYRPELEKLTHDLGVTNHFIWTGFVPDPWVVMAVCNLTVLPTRAEGFGRVVIESWAVERAVVASDVDGPGEVIRLAGGGLLHTVEDHLALAESIIQLLTDSTLSAELAMRGNLWVKQYCSPTEYRSQFIGHLQNFIKR
jgi:glycosyltransferase involved in cell wall biosynthesis